MEQTGMKGIQDSAWLGGESVQQGTEREVKILP